MRIDSVHFCAVCLVSFSLAALAQSLTAPQVETARKRSENHIQFENLQFNGSLLRRSGFDLAVGADESAPSHVIEGVNQSGQAVRIPFSEIISIRNLGSDGRRIDLEIVRFPDISSQDLVQLNPDCEQLARYRKVLRVIIEQPSGHPLYWLGSDDDLADIKKIGRLADMQEGINMQLRLPVNQTWWAIPSILRDPLCPVSTLDPLGGSGIQPPRR